MATATVTVTGASGKTGRHVVALAGQRGWRVRYATRRPPEQGDWSRLDWDDDATWAPAFAGSDATYVMIPFNHPGAPQRTPALLRAAAEAGVSRIVLLSSLDADGAAEDDPLRRAELALLGLPVRSAIVRPTWFLDNFTHGSFAAMVADGELRLPAGDGRIPFIDARDVAAVAVAAMAAGGPTGILPATGPEAITHHEVVAALAEAARRTIRYTPVGAAEFVDLLTRRGFPRSYGEFLAAALVDVATGRLRIPVVDTVERVTGRKPFTVRDFARLHAATLSGLGHVDR